MLCKIADLFVEIPSVGDMPDRCKKYLSNGKPDIIIEKEKLRENSSPNLSYNSSMYLEVGLWFYLKLINFDGMMLHSSAVVVDNKAYLFSGPCGIGKSTHTKIWKKHFGDRAVIINDDKPAIRFVDGKWYAYGTPFCGKDGINENQKAEIAGICFLHRGDTKIKRLSPLEAFPQILIQTSGRGNVERAKKLLALIEKLINDIPMFDFYNHADDSDCEITYNNMKEAMYNEKK